MEKGRTVETGSVLVLEVSDCILVGAEGTEIEMDPDEVAEGEAKDDDAGAEGAEGTPAKMSSCAPTLKPLRRLYAGVCEPWVTTLFPVSWFHAIICFAP